MTTPNNSTTATTRAPADNHTRGDLVGGRLRRLVDQGIQGVTSNPTIIAKAIDGSADYDRQLATLAAQGRDAEASYWSLVADDLNGALAVLRPVYDRGGGADGFVSVEPAPALARDAEASVAAGRALHRRLDAPNLLVKIPGHRRGRGRRPAGDRQGPEHQRAPAVRPGPLRGDHHRGRPAPAGHRHPPRPLPSRARRRWPRQGWPTGCSGTASAAPAGRHWPPGVPAPSGRCGPRPRPKNPAYPDTVYVDSLIGPDTITALPEPTIAAFEDHSTLATTITRGAQDAQATLERLAAVGIALRQTADVLEAEGVAAFANSYDELLALLQARADSSWQVPEGTRQPGARSGTGRDAPASVRTRS